MKIIDKGILISIKKFGDNDLLASFLTIENGILSGLIKGGNSKKKRADFQIGNFFSIEWTARLESQLGFFTHEMITPTSIDFFSNKLKLLTLSNICKLLKLCIMEKEPHSNLFIRTNTTLQEIKNTKEAQDITALYIIWEISLLKEIGFALDFSKCNATDSTENLTYISPVSGKAVCATAGEPYKEKLFKLPQYLINKTNPSKEELELAFKITTFFLEKNILEHHLDNSIINSRKDLIEQMLNSI